MEFSSVCRICGATRLRDVPFGYDFEGAHLRGRMCRSCGVIFLDPQPDAGQIRRMYSREYFNGDFRCGHEGGYFDEQTLVKLSGNGIIAEIKKIKPTGRMLEIGCAGGALLNSARAAGFEVRGVEMSPEAAAFARDRFDLDVFAGDLRDAQFASGRFDVVYMGDVIEHLPDPVAVIAEIARVLSGGGLLVVACPTQTNTLFSRFGFFVYGLIGKRATVRMPPYHLFEYRPASMSGLMHRCGFSIVRMDVAMLSPEAIAQRGSILQNIGKKAFQHPNRLLTHLSGRWGDRLTVYAQKHD
jgi:SAM-dependent methyltransferase